MTEQTPVIQPWQNLTLIAGKTLFTILIASQLAGFTWMIVAPSSIVLTQPRQAQAVDRTASQQSIADWHLFGDATAEVAEIDDKIVAQPTRLRLELLGVMAGDGEKGSSAIIAPKGGAGDYYRIGDTVQGRTKLAKVEATRVILDTNGKLEALQFEEKRSQKIQQTSAPVRKASRGAGGSGSLRDRFSNVRSAADAVDLIRGEVGKDPRGALNQLGLEPVADGSAEGYKVSNSGSMLTQLGLQPGDVILSVNGQSLGNVNDDQLLLEQVTGSGQARLEIQRGNRRFVVNHKIK